MGVCTQSGSALEWRGGHEIVRIEPWGAHSVRVRGTVWQAIRDDLPGALLASPPPASTASAPSTDGTASTRSTASTVELGGERSRLINGDLTAEISASGQLRFLRADGGELLSETTPHFTGPPTRRYKTTGGGTHHFEVLFNARDDERFYGLGQHQHGRLNQKGAVVELVQRNTEVSIPFLVSSRGYGLLWNHPGIGRVELGTTVTRWVSEATRQWDYWVTAASEPAGILRQYGEAAGRTPMLPEWASGFWQCKLRYKTQDELLGVAREYKRRGLPLSVIVIDYFHWTLQGEWKFDPEEWPDPEGMVKELDQLGVKLMVSVWPTVSPASENYAEMKDLGLLVDNERGMDAQVRIWDRGAPGRVPMAFYDSTSPQARAYIWSKVRENYLGYGIKTWWLDACEPELVPEQPENLRYHLGPGAEVSNIYPMLHVRGFYEGMRDEGEEEILSLCRSAWAGSQRYGALVWSGDIDSTFEDLRRQIPGGLNIGLSGIPWWTTDIGGFKNGNLDDPSFRELIVRWFQFGVFCPVFRLHGIRQPGTMIGAEQTGAANEIWSFGDEQYEIIRRLLFLRERLRPYVLDQMRVARDTGLPPMRPVFLDYPADPVSWEVEDQFLFGSDILVAPVCTEGARERRVYLPAGPAGTTWRDAWTGAEHQGGQWITAPAPLELVPVYCRAGGAVGPFGAFADLAPAEAGPAEAEPAEAAAAEAGPAEAEPAEAAAAEAGPAETEPTEAAAAETGPAETGPAETGPAETGPAETGPARTGGE